MKPTNHKIAGHWLRLFACATSVVAVCLLSRSGAAPAPARMVTKVITAGRQPHLDYKGGHLSGISSTDPDSSLREAIDSANHVTEVTYGDDAKLDIGPGGSEGHPPITMTSPGGKQIPIMWAAPFAPPGYAPPTIPGFSAPGTGFIISPGGSGMTFITPPVTGGKCSLNPDLFKTADFDGPRPTDRIFLNYNYYQLNQGPVTFTPPTTLGTYLPFTIVKPDGTVDFYGALPSIPSGWLKPTTFTPPPSVNQYWIPQTGQAGKPIFLYGPFSGDTGQTQVIFNGDPVDILGETSTSLMFKLPLDIAGTTNLHVDDGLFHYKSPFSTIGLKLISDDRVLQPGEHDAFRVRVTGLHDIKKPVEVNIIDLEQYIVAMDGGPARTFTIAPGSGDTVTRDYGLTAIQKGAADIVAWVPQQWTDTPIDGGPKVADSTGTTETTGTTTVDTTGTTTSTGHTTGDTTGTTTDTGGTTGNTTGQTTGATTGATTGSSTGDSTGNTTGDTTGDTTGTTHKDNSQPGIAQEGWFEPVEGVWQDDEKFADKPTKQITQISPTYWNAELAMIQNRPTRLYGLRGDKHTYIEMKGQTNRTIEVPVRFRFTLYEGNLPPKVLYIQPAASNSVFVDGPRGPIQNFDAKLYAFDGIGKTDGTSFVFDQTGPYKIVADLIKPDGSSTGIEVTVAGNTVATQPPLVVFQPLLLEDKVNAVGQDILGAEAVRLKNEAKRMASESVDYIPKIFPLEPGNLHVDPRPTKDFRTEVADSKSSWHLNPFTTKEQDLFNDLAAKITARYGQMVTVEKNSRIIVVVSKDAFKLLSPTKNAVAFAESHKVMFAPDTTTADTVAHELCHTLPWPWADEEMVDEFGFDYHDEFDQNYADGAEIHTGDYEKRWPHAHATMGNAYPIDTQWITQGTYWHLIKQLTQKVDPPVVCVSGEIADDQHGHQDAIISPLYDQMGTVDLAEGSGDWEIRLVDASGKVQHSYPFDPVWTLPDRKTRDTFRGINECVPYLPTTAEIDIVGPGGKVLAQRMISKHAPEVAITSPIDGATPAIHGGNFTVTWTGNDPDKGTLLYSVMYSDDDGGTWHTVSFEQAATTCEVPVVGSTGQERVKVVATNGSRSSEAEVGFKVPIIH